MKLNVDGNYYDVTGKINSNHLYRRLSEKEILSIEHYYGNPEVNFNNLTLINERLDNLEKIEHFNPDDDIPIELGATRFNEEDAVIRFARKLKGMGVDEELQKLGIEEGDLVRIDNFEFEYTLED